VSRVVIAGAGASGVRCGELLLNAGVDVSIVERLPAPGGQEPERETRRMAAKLEKRGAHLILGTLIVSYENGWLITLGVSGEQRMPCDVLVVATGMRPATRGELRITGDRCAGVMPRSAMAHLLEVGVLPGYRPVVSGGGARAIECAEMLLRGGAKTVTVVAPVHREADLPAEVSLYIPYSVERVHGHARVTHVSLVHERNGALADVAADALILAAGERPMLNIEGAIQDTPGVVFCHASAEGEGFSIVAQRAADAAMAALVQQTVQTVHDPLVHAKEKARR
jgi:D-hydroxyproline dehydrogenase subunit alpha